MDTCPTCDGPMIVDPESGFHTCMTGHLFVDGQLAPPEVTHAQAAHQEALRELREAWIEATGGDPSRPLPLLVGTDADGMAMVRELRDDALAILERRDKHLPVTDDEEAKSRAVVRYMDAIDRELISRGKYEEAMAAWRGRPLI